MARSVKFNQNKKTESVNSTPTETKTTMSSEEQRKKSARDREFYSGLDKKLQTALKTDNSKKAIANKTLENTKASENKKLEARSSAKKIVQNAKIDGYLNSDRKLTKQEKKETKGMVKDYFKNNEQANKLRKAQTGSRKTAQAMYESMSPEEQKEYDRMSALWNKNSGIASFSGGMLEALPMFGNTVKKYDESNNRSRSAADSLKNVKTQNLGANVAGNVVSNLGQYAIAIELLGGLKGYDAVGKGATNLIPGLENATGEAIGNVLRGQTADTLLDTLPNLVNDINDGKSGKDVALNALKNQAINLGFNVLGEGIGNTFDAYKKLKNEGKEVANATNDLDFIDILNDAELDRGNYGRVSNQLDDRTKALVEEYAKRQNQTPGYSTLSNQLDDRTQALVKEYADIQNNPNPGYTNLPSVNGTDNLAQEYSRYQNIGKRNTDPMVAFDTNFSKNQAKSINSMLEGEGSLAETIKVNNDRINALRSQQDALERLPQTDEVIRRYEELEDEITSLEDANSLLSNPNALAQNQNYTSLPQLNSNGDTSIRTSKGTISISPELVNGTNSRTVSRPIAEETENVAKSVSDKKVIPSLTEEPKIKTSKKKETLGNSLDSELDFVEEEQNLLKNYADDMVEDVVNTTKANNDAKISQHYETLKKSEMFKSAEAQAKLDAMKKDGVFNKVGGVEKRAKSMDKAAREFAQDPNKVINDVLRNNEWTSGLDVDKSALCINDALESGNNALLNRLSRVENIKLTQSGRILRAVQDNYIPTAGGTISQGTKYMLSQADTFLKKGGKAAQECVDMAERAVKNGSVAELVSKGMDNVNAKAISDALDLGADAEEISKMIAMYQKLGTVQISDSTINEIKNIYNQIEKGGYGINSKKRAELEAKAYSLLANEIGGNRSLKQKWDSWRYLAMLGNTRTHIRNIFGNAMQFMVTEVKDNVGAMMEGLADNVSKTVGGEGIDRTKAILNRLSESDNELVKMARSDADNEAYRMLNDMGSKYNEVKGMVEQNRNAFDSKFMNIINDFNSNALEGEDYLGLKVKYSKALSRYLKANGADASIFKASDDTSKQLLEKAREYAVDQAKQATFHEYSVMADKLSKMSQAWMYGEKANTASKAGSIALESLVPFKKTPINVLKQGIKYSPVSIAKALTSDIAKLSKGTINASEMIEDLAAGMTGTGILALGAFLANQGYINGKGNTDYNVNNADKKQGKQEYAIQIGDKSYTIDWLAPFSLPLFVGAELYNQMSNGYDDDESTLDKILTSISTIGEPITEMSMLQGINDSLEQLSYSKESALGTLGGNLLTGYATQGIPTALGQISRSVDPTRRSTYSDQENGFKKQVQRSVLKSMNKIPGLSSLNEEYRNEWGETEENTGGSVLGRLAYNMLSPGYYADNSNATSVDNELQRLYSTTGESPFTGTSSGKVGDSKLSRQDYTEYQTLYGQNSKSIVNSIMNNSAYNELSDSDKVEVIKKAYNISKAIADYEVGGKAVSDSNSKLYDIYKKSGVNGLAESLLTSRQEKIAKEQNEATALAAGFVKENGKADVSGYKKAQEIASEYGDNAEAYTAITRTQNGTNKNGEAKYLSYNEKNLKIYNEKGQDGLDIVVAIKENLPSDYNNNDLMDLIESSDLSDDEKAYYYMNMKSGELATVPSLMDDPYNQYQWYYIKSVLDKDGNGSLNKSEKANLVPVLQNLGYDADSINYIQNYTYTTSSGKTKTGWY